MNDKVLRLAITGLSVLLVLLLFGVASVPDSMRASSPHQSPVAAAKDTLCPSLPSPTGETIIVSSVSEVMSAVNSVSSGTTILIADGTYELNGEYLRFATPGVTLRSASGNRDAVVLDGNYASTEIIQIVASNVSIADLTLREAYYHPIHVMSSDSADTDNTLIYNVHIVDPGQQAIKINPASAGFFPDNGTIACSHIELTDVGRQQVWNINESCYTGGVDAHQAWGWTISDNVIEGFWCASDLSEHGVHFWTGSRGTVVQRNVLIDNARGVGFGLGESPGSASWRTYVDDPCPGADDVGHYDGIIRNNFIFASRDALFSSEYGFDCGICLEQACGAQVPHSTVVSIDAPASSSIEWRFDNTDVDIINNLVSHNLQDRGGTALLQGNLESASLSLFENGTSGDLHLAASASLAIDQGAALDNGVCDDDIDGDPRPLGSARDIGGDEYGTSPPSAVTDLYATRASIGDGSLTAVLRWTAPAEALTYTLRFSESLINDAGWDSAVAVAVPFVATPGATEWLTTSVSYDGGVVYFALRSQNADGAWSDLSNNAFWPRWRVFLPVVIKGGS